MTNSAYSGYVAIALATLAGAVVTSLAWSRLSQSKPKKRKSTIPGPEPVNERDGNAAAVGAAKSFFEYLLDLHKTYGPIAGFSLGSQYIVSTASPQLLKEQTAMFDRAVQFFENMIPMIGEKSIQYINGAEGRRRHTAYSKCYTPQAMGQYFDNLNKLSGLLLRHWKALPVGTDVPLIDNLLPFAIKAMLQGSMGSFFENDALVESLTKAYKVTWADIDARFGGDFPVSGSNRENQFNKGIAVLRKATRDALAYRRDNPPEDGEKLIIDAALEVMVSEDQLEDDMITIFVGGFHTSAYLMIWGMYFLAKYKDIQDKVYDEIIQVLGDDDQVNPDNIKDLKYMRQVFDEVLRQLPLGTTAARVNSEDCTLGGHHIPAGTPIIQALGVVFKDPDVFPDPERFDPSRFDAKNVKARGSCAFEPFGLKRRCPGYRFSLAEAAIVMSDLLKSFEVSLVPGQDIGRVHGLVTVPTTEIFINISPRK